ncbi:Protein ILM1 [Nakaseomyces bracarensis]|uniref:Protein ILM1 n=1 Tax=Nakaseomyces bracarensis TaxID=273131 RepID=A0ABR4NRF8_9SACH
MGILSSQNLILFRTSLLLTIAFFCIKDVNCILQNTYFIVLTQAMDLPALTISPYSGQLGLISFIFFLLAVHDIIPFLEGNKVYFRSIVPARLTVYFIIGAVSFLWTDNLYVHNNGVFIYTFVEIWINFLLLNAVREERNEDFRQEHQFLNEDAIIEEPTPFEEAKKD